MASQDHGIHLFEECVPEGMCENGLPAWSPSILTGWWDCSLLLLLVCVVRAWSSFPIFSSQATIQDFSCEHSSHSLLNVINFLLAQIPWIKESHDLGRPFNVVITTSPFSTSSPTASSCSLIWETLVKSMTIWSLHSGSSHSSTVFSKSSSDLCPFLQIAWSRKQTSLSVSLGKTLVV